MNRKMGRIVASLGIFGFSFLSCLGDGPDDNRPDRVRLVPPPGIEVPPASLSTLSGSVAKIRSELIQMETMADVDRCAIEVFARAVEMTIEHNMFYSEAEVKQAEELLLLAQKRMEEYGKGKRGWELLLATERSQGNSKLIVGGFRSKLDGSIQPWGAVVPANWKPDSNHPVRVDIWLHGRDEKTSEVGFLARRVQNAGEFAPENTIVLHPYGRYSNAFKFAGEIDVLEGLAHLKSLVPVDENRISIRGFSMGGAGCWQMAVHYPQLWFASAPGAGFSETTEFLRVFQNENYQPSDVQRSLLHWYDCPDWTNNLRLLPTIAYSGELDRQKQAADVMADAFLKRNMKLMHIIGPATEHKYHPDSKLEIEKQMNEWATQGRSSFPKQIDFTTYSLRYSEDRWLKLHTLDKHWMESRVMGSRTEQGFELKTQNIRKLEIAFDAKQWDSKLPPQIQIVLDGDTIAVKTNPVGKNSFLLERLKGEWQMANQENESNRLTKSPGLQGPIDDAFMEPFLFVVPDRSNASPTIADQWVASESAHAMKEWRRHFRGDIVMKRASEVTSEDIATKNIIAFGTPGSNSFIERVANKLPIHWTNEKMEFSGNSVPSDKHVPILIYPNPENPKHYLVLNSGFTFREYAYLNNARQIPMLGDWAIVDVREGSTSRLPGKIVAEGFFNEEWK